MRADNEGEGGIFALMTLIKQKKDQIKLNPKLLLALNALIIFGAALLYGDGMITPAISVLSAVEGLNVVAPSFHPYVIGITIIILIALFLLQRQGTHRIGKLFGPIMIMWFVAIVLIAIPPLTRHPEVFLAINPLYGLRLLIHEHIASLFILGLVVLCITGGEALYADMGHFGRKGISVAWLGLVLPALLLNYFGQGAHLLDGTTIIGGNIFFSLVPSYALFPMVVLATMATIVASQALISGAYSLTQQAIGLGVLPRLRILQTNQSVPGQIYIPTVNWILLVGCIFIVLGFRTSVSLAAAYGIAVTGTMAITTIAFYVVARYIWKWELWRAAGLCVPLLLIDLVFVVANSLKIFEGGFVPLLVASCLYWLMSVWQWGKEYRAHVIHEASHLTIRDFLRLYQNKATVVIPRTIVVMSPVLVEKLDDLTPIALQVFLERWRAVPARLVLLTVTKERHPYIASEERFTVYSFSDALQDEQNVISVQVRYGYMEDPDVRTALADLQKQHLLHVSEDPQKWLIITGRERFISTVQGIIPKMRLAFFRLMHANTKSAISYFGDLDADAEVVIVGVNM